MTKKWYFPFEYRVWQSDPALSQCSLAARGFWLEILCAMYAQDVYKVSGSLERIARMTRCESAEVAKFSLELKDADVCDVTLGHGDVTIVSRRLQRLLTTKEKNTLRKRKQRGHGDVTIHSNSNSKSKEIREEKRGANAPAPLFEIFLGSVESALSKRLGISSLPNRREWHQKLAWAYENNFTADSVIECYDLLKLDEFWQTKSISAKTLTAQLPNLESLRRGAKQHKRTEKLPTTAEKLADAATNNAALIQPPKPITIGAMQ